MVRVSTTAQNVQPDTPIYYGRTHWAMEQLLSQPEYSSLQWTSLQPNVFTTGLYGTVPSNSRFQICTFKSGH